MKITLSNGTGGEITHDEARRIVSEIGVHANLPGMQRGFLDRALDNIEKATGKRPGSEEELKNLMYEHLPLGTKEETCLLYEAVEAIVGWHAHTTK